MEKPEGEIFIIPARLEECENLESLRKWHWVDLFEDNGYKRLMLALNEKARRIDALFELQERYLAVKSSDELFIKKIVATLEPISTWNKISILLRSFFHGTPFLKNWRIISRVIIVVLVSMFMFMLPSLIRRLSIPIETSAESSKVFTPIPISKVSTSTITPTQTTRPSSIVTTMYLQRK